MPGFYQARKYMPIFRDQYQPVTFLGQGLLFITKKAINKNKPAHEDEREKNANVRKELKLRTQKIKYETGNFLDVKSTIDQNALILQDYIKYFQKEGVVLCFFEMPRDCDYLNDKGSIYSRGKLQKIITANSLATISLPACEDYSTSDGLHLTDESSKKYTAYFLKEMAKLHDM